MSLLKHLTTLDLMLLRRFTPKFSPLVGSQSRRNMSSNDLDKVGKDDAVKFSTSNANVGYVAARNFYGDDRDLPDSHNIFLFSSIMSAVLYLFWFRDNEVDNDGGVNLIKPLHETMPHMAIPLLKSAINENRRFGLSTAKLEEKLAEYMKEPEKHGYEKLKYRDI